MLGAIAAVLARPSRAGWLVSPDTLLRWHRRRIARHWAQPQRPPGRPSTAAELRRLTLRLAAENPTWGYRRIHGELRGLGHPIAASTVWQILNNARIDPAPTRSEVTWSQFLRSQAAVACDFATIETVTLRRFYLLFFIDIATRTVYFAGVTDHPTGVWTTQAARNLLLQHGHQLTDAQALVRDRASQFIDAFDEIFRTEGCKVLTTPVRTPVANAFAERWIANPSTRAPRPHHHLEPPPTQQSCRRLHRSLQHAPAPPCTRPATTRRHRRGRPARWTPPSRENGPLWWTHQRVPKCRLTSHDTVFGTHTTDSDQSST